MATAAPPPAAVPKAAAVPPPASGALGYTAADLLKAAAHIMQTAAHGVIVPKGSSVGIDGATGDLVVKPGADAPEWRVPLAPLGPGTLTPPRALLYVQYLVAAASLRLVEHTGLINRPKEYLACSRDADFIESFKVLAGVAIATRLASGTKRGCMGHEFVHRECHLAKGAWPSLSTPTVSSITLSQNFVVAFDRIPSELEPALTTVLVFFVVYSSAVRGSVQVPCDLSIVPHLRTRAERLLAVAQSVKAGQP